MKLQKSATSVVLLTLVAVLLVLSFVGLALLVGEKTVLIDNTASNGGTPTVNTNGMVNAGSVYSSDLTVTVENTTFEFMGRQPTDDDLGLNVIYMDSSVDATITYQYSINGGSTWISGLPYEPGTYPCKVTAEYTPAAEKLTAVEEFELVINKKVVTLEGLVTEFTYNGQVQKPTVTGVNGAADGFPVTANVSGGYTSVGENYKAVVTLSDNKNYELQDAVDGELVVTYSITPKSLTITWGETELEYNGKEQVPSFTSDEVSEGDAGIVLSEGGVVPGPYSVTPTVTSQNYTLTNPEACEFNITKKALTEELLAEIPAQPYTGNAIHPVLRFVNPDEPMVESRDYVLTYGANVEAGVDVGTVTITILPGGYYTYDGDTLTLTFSITKLLSEMGFIVSDMEYTGEELRPELYLADGTVFDPASFGVSITYSDNINVGQATIKLVAEAGSIYEGESTFNFTINARELTVEWDGETLVYTGARIKPNFKVTNFLEADYDKIMDAINRSLSYDGVNVGTYSASFTLSEEAWAKNYKLVSNKFSYSISPRTIDVEWSVQADGYFYNGDELGQSPVVIGTQSVIITILDSNGETVPAAVNVGTYTAVAALDDKNYVVSEATRTQSFNILPKRISVVWNLTNEEGNLTYTGSAVKPTATLSGVIGDDVVNLTVNVQEGGVNVADNSVAVATIDNANYELDSSATVQYKVFAKELKQEMLKTIETQLFVNAQLTPKVEFTVEEPILVDRDYTVVYGGNLEGTGTATITTVATGNYYISGDPIVLSFNISKSLDDFNITLVGDTVYDTTAKFPNLVIGGVEFTAEQLRALGFTVEYANNTEVSVETKASVKVTPDGTVYTGSAKTVQFDILKRTITAVWTQTEFTYSGFSKFFFPTYELQGILASDLEVVTFSAVGSASMAAEGYTAKLQLANVEAFPAYYNTPDLTTTFSILPREITVQWTNSFEYDGKEHMPVAVVETGVEGETVELTTNAEPLTNVGSQEIVAEVVASPYSSNYKLLGSEVTFEVYAKELQINWSDLAFVYDGKAHTPKATVSTGIEGEYIVLNVKGTATEAGNYKATASMVEQNDNYVLANPTVDFVVKHPSVATSDNSVTVSAVNGINPNWKVSVANLELSTLTTLPKDQKALAYYDIKMLDGQTEVQPDGTVKVTIKLTADQVAKFSAVYHIDDSGVATKIPASIDGEFVTFEVEHFSNFAITTYVQSSLWLILTIVIAVVMVAAATVLCLVLFKKSK